MRNYFSRAHLRNHSVKKIKRGWVCVGILKFVTNPLCTAIIAYYRQIYNIHCILIGWADPVSIAMGWRGGCRSVTEPEIIRAAIINPSAKSFIIDSEIAAEIIDNQPPEVALSRGIWIQYCFGSQLSQIILVGVCGVHGLVPSLIGPGLTSTIKM
jgi:hypothetical protein